MHAVTFQRERAHDLWGEIEPLLEAHYREIATFQDIPLAPDRERYNTAEDNGMLRCYTARIAGKLIGYAVFFVSQHAHYGTSKQAVQDVVFISAEHRRGRLGLEMLRYAENALKDEGVDVAHHHVKVKHPALGKLLEHMGYAVTEHVYTKRIQRGA
jgi:GNAT superfamily N-acetyltransferase